MHDKRQIFDVPEGYFSSLEMKLSFIPSRAEAASCRTSGVSSRAEAASVQAGGHRFRFFARVLSACVACLCAALVLGIHFSRQDDVLDVVDLYERYYYADLIPLTDPDMLFDMSQVVETCTSEEIEEYLIESDISLSMIEQAIN